MRRRYLHFTAAVAIAVIALSPGFLIGQQSPRQIFERAKIVEDANTDLPQAIRLYEQVIAQSKDRALTAEALLRMGGSYERLGSAEARKPYERITKEFSDRKEAFAAANERLRVLDNMRSVPNSMTQTRIWTGHDVTFNRPSPDGHYLVGTSPAGLLVHDLFKNTDLHLHAGESPQHPCFTQDSKRILFDWSKGDRHEIRIVNIDGTNEKTILRSDKYSTIEISAVSSDGKLAAVGLILRDDARPRQPPFWQIGLVSLDSGNIQILTSLEWRDTYSGNFSPDGHWLVYSAQASKDGIDGAIYTIAIDGSGKHTLAAQAVTHDAPFFTPDGSRVVYVSGEGFTSNPVLTGGTSHKALYSIRVAEGKPLGNPEIIRPNVSTGYFSGAGLGFAKDGSYYFSEIATQNSVYVAEVDPATWKLRNVPEEISDSFHHEAAIEPAWSPNGKFLAFVDNSSEEDKVIIHDIDTGMERVYPTHVAQMNLRGWSSDGKSLLLSGPPAGVRFFNIETQVESPFSLTTPQPVISADGKSIFYFRIDGQEPAGMLRLIRRDLQGGKETEVYRSEVLRSSVTFLSAAPDGRSLGLVFARPADKSRMLWVLSLSGGEPHALPSVDTRDPIAWTQDSSAVLFGRSNGIWVQRLDGGDPYSTGIQMDRVVGPMVHPDGSHIAFSGIKTNRNIWKFSNLFPLASTGK